MFLGQKIQFKDYKSFDPVTYNSLLNLANEKVDANYELYFAITYFLNGEIKEKELIINGENHRVLEENKFEFIYYKIKFLVFEKYKEAIKNLV